MRLALAVIATALATATPAAAVVPEVSSFVHVAADAIFGDVECLTNEGSSTATFADDLSSATLTGSVTGSCFDFAQEKESSYSAEFDLTWTAVGRLERRAFGMRLDGTVCSTMVVSREAVATGTLTWSAPQLGIGGT